MNSLAYLSRQYDVLASTPPSTPAEERPAVDLPVKRPAHNGRAKRTRSWVRDGLLMPSSRSKSSPALSSVFALPQQKPQQQPAASKPPAVPHAPVPLQLEPPAIVVHAVQQPVIELRQWAVSRWRRTWIVRTWIALWDAIANAWRIILRAHILSEQPQQQQQQIVQPHRIEDSSSDSEDDILVARARPRRSPIQPPPPDTDTEPSTPYTDTDSMRVSIPHRDRTLSGAGSALLPAPLANYLLSYTPAPTPPIALSATPPPAARTRPGIHLPKTLVLDLDETLIHSTQRPLHAVGSAGGGLLGFGGRRGVMGGHMVEVVLNGRSTLYHVYKRPFVDYFLRKVSSWYTVVIFTASMQEYADPVIDWLDGGRGILLRRFFRESCTQLPSGTYSKDLSIIEPDLSRVALVDNSPASYSINQTNGIPIEGWTHDQSDEALLDLLPFLDSLRFTSDVRRVLGIRGFQ